MFNFGRVEEIVPLSIAEDVLTFTSAKKYKVGKTVKAKLILVCNEKVETPQVSLQILDIQEALDETYTCLGKVRLNEKNLQALYWQMTLGGIAGADRRATKRLPCTVRILSRELKSYRAVTTNINLTGAELSCDDPVEPGHTMALQFDLSSVGIPDLKLTAVCIWSLEDVSTDRRGSRHRVGVAFPEHQSDNQVAWTRFYQKLLSEEGASVMLKTMDGASITEKRTETAYHEGTMSDSMSSSGSYPIPTPLPSPTSPTGNPFTESQGSTTNPPSSASSSGGYPVPTPTSPPNWPVSPSSPSSSGGYPVPTPPGPQNWPASPSSPSSSGGFPVPTPAVPPNFLPPPSSAWSSGGFPVPSPGGPLPEPPVNAFFEALGPSQPPRPPSQPDPPERVMPLGIQGAQIMFSCLSSPTLVPGVSKQIELSFDLEGQVTLVKVNTSLTRIEPAPNNVSVCWATVLEDEQKIQVLNRLLAR